MNGTARSMLSHYEESDLPRMVDDDAEGEMAMFDDDDDHRDASYGEDKSFSNSGKKGGSARLDEQEKKVRNRQSSQRFRNRVKERQNATKDRLRWLEDRVLVLTDELKAARSGQASAYPDFRIDDDGPFVPLTGKDSQNPEMAVKWLRSENDRLKHALRKLQDENEQLRAAAVLQPQMWTEPEQHFQVIDSKVGAIRRSGSFQHHAHAPIQARRGSVSASQHSRVSSYSSSYASHLTGASSASSYAQQGQHPSLSLDFSQIRPAFPHHHSADVYTRPRSQSAASDWTTLSSPAGSAHSRQGSLSAGAGGQSYGLGLAQYMSSLPTVPGSATIPAESFADIQVNSRSESLPGHLANRLTMEGPTPTIASNANWRAAQAQAMLAGGSGGGGQAMLSASQYASYPSALPLYRTQGSAPEVYADQAILTPGGVMPRPATALPVQTVYSGPESGTITPEELLGQVVTSSSGPNEQDVAVP